jgi:hypothetical protein
MNITVHEATRSLGLRRRLLIGVLGALTTPLWAAAPDAPLVEVWKSTTCGCCGDWMHHLEANGFRTKVYDEGNAAMRARIGIASHFGSCHTAMVASYGIEGHVPTREIRRLLKERPTAIGLAVPGMPIGSPGMDGPEYAGRKDPYQVRLLGKYGRSSVNHAYA